MAVPARYLDSSDMSPGLPGGPGGPAGPAPPLTSYTRARSVPKAWVVAGYVAAHDRVNAAYQHRDSPDLLFIPLFEALNWAGALEEKARPHNDPLLAAVRLARNRVLHQWADAVEGRSIPNPAGLVVRPLGAGVGRSGIIGPPVVWEWFWLDRASLPSGTNNQGGPAYDGLLAGRPVRDALDQLRTKF